MNISTFRLSQRLLVSKAAQAQAAKYQNSVIQRANTLVNQKLSFLSKGNRRGTDQEYEGNDKHEGISTESLLKDKNHDVANLARHQTSMNISIRKYSLLRLKHQATAQSNDRTISVREFEEQVKKVEEDVREDIEKNLTPEEKTYRRNVALSSLGALFFINLLLLCAEAILPTFIEEHFEKKITEDQVSLILAAPEFACLVLAPIVGIALEKWGRKTLIGVLGTAFLADIDKTNPQLYIWGCIVARLFQGAGDITIQTVMYSAMTNTFFECKEVYLGYGEAAAGLGLMTGPIIGGFLYNLFNVKVCYIVLAMIIFLDVIFTMIFLPSNPASSQGGIVSDLVSENNEFQEKGDNKSSNNSNSLVPYSWFIMNRRSLFAFITVAFTMLIANFKSAFIILYLQDVKNIEKEYHGWIIGIPAMFYVIACNVIGRIVDKAPRRVFLAVSLVAMTIFSFMMGPSKMLGMPDNVWVLLIATCLKDVAQGFLFIPVLPEVIDAIYQQKGLIEGDNDQLDVLLNDKAAALYGLAYAVGAIIAPLAGSWVYESTNYDWRYTCDIFSIFSGLFTVFFIVFNVLPDIHKEKQLRQELLDKQIAKSPFDISVDQLDKDDSDDKVIAGIN